MTIVSIQHDAAALAAIEFPGTGTPLLFLHATLLSSAIFSDLMAALPGHHRLALDFRGHGTSPLPAHRKESLSLAHFEQDALAAIAYLGGPIHIIGESLGGIVALSLALHHPELVGSLTLLSTAADDQPAVLKPVFSGFADALDHSGLSSDLLDLAIQMFLSLPVAADRSSGGVRARLNALLLGLDPKSGAAVLRAMNTRPDLRPNLGTITIPTIFFVGTGDAAIAPERQLDTCGHMPRAQRVVVPGGGHLLSVEQPALVAHTIRSLIATGSPA
jgi:3-oxoadipate enol-lactonase